MNCTARSFGSAFMLLIMLCTPNAMANECPDNNQALDLQAARFEPNWSHDGDWINFVAPTLNYDVSQMYEPILTGTPLVTLRASISAFQNNYGWYHLSSHGEREIFAVEFYPTANQRNQAVTFYQSAAGGSYTAAEIGSVDVGTSFFGIGIKLNGMRRGAWTGSYVHLLSCFGSTLTLGMPGAKSVIGHNFEVTTTGAQADDRLVIENLAGFHAFNSRTIGQAISGTTLVLAGRSDLELAPAVAATDLVQSQYLKSTVTRYVHFTGPMNTAVNPSLVVKGWGSLHVKGAVWQGNDQISFQVEPRYKGAGGVKVLSDTLGFLESLTSIPGFLPLVGNVHGPSPGIGGPPGTSGHAGFGNYEVAMYSESGGQNPVAAIASYMATFSGSSTKHTFVTDVEDGVGYFLIRRSSSPDGPFITVGTVPPKGPSRYDLDDPLGQLGEYVELWEVTASGDSIRRDATRTTWPVEQTPDPIIDPIDAQRIMDVEGQRYRQQNGVHRTNPILEWAALIPDESWRTAVQPEADFWAGMGMSTGIFTLQEVNAYGGPQNFVRSWVPYGLRYWLRVGDYNNADYHNNPLYYTGPIANGGNGWSNAAYGSQPQYRVLPLTYVLDPTHHQPTSTTNLTPEAPIILDGDVDGDSLSDIAVGIWPARSPAEAALMGLKSRKYFSQTANGNTIAAWGDFRNLNNNDGQYAQSLYEEALGALPSGQTVTRVYATDTNGGADPAVRQSWGISSLASRPNAISLLTTTTTRVNWALINKLANFRWSMSPVTSLYPYASFATCDVFDWDRSEDVISLPTSPRPLMEEALLDTLRGPAFGWGFPRGTFVKADQYALVAHNEIAYRVGASSGGEAMMIAIRNAALAHPEYKFQFMTAVYFGDPAMPIKGFIQRATTGVGDTRWASTSLRAVENPSRHRVTFAYTPNGEPSNELNIYDLNGRRVWSTELPSAPGIHHVTWNGQTLKGMPASPGLYLVRGRQGPAFKITLLR